MLLTKALVLLVLSIIFAKVDTVGNTFFGMQKPSSIGWLTYFYAWDSGWYSTIAKVGYSAKAYAFLPLYPLMMKVIGAPFGDPVLAGFLISNILGFLCIPLFQNLAERYMPRKEAFWCTILFASFPYVMVFTSAIYTESLYLFATVSAWLLYKDNKVQSASFAAAIATLTKVYGILILIPMLVDILSKREWKRLPVVVLPITFLVAWMGYLYSTVGDPLAFVTANAKFWGTGQTSLWWLISPIITGEPIEYLRHGGTWALTVGGDWWAPFALTTIFLLFGLMAAKVGDLDRPLAVFSTAILVFFIAAAPLYSIVRYFSFIFPIWMTLQVRKRTALFILLPLFFLMSVVLWYQFLLGWIG